jgi:hypothetical protein
LSIFTMSRSFGSCPTAKCRKAESNLPNKFNSVRKPVRFPASYLALAPYITPTSPWTSRSLDGSSITDFELVWFVD